MDIPSHWREVENVFLDFPHYNCVVCAPGHPFGFASRYWLDEEEDAVVSPVRCGPDMAGFPGVLHGGFQAMLLDEVIGWYAIGKLTRLLVTARLNVKYAGTVRTTRPLLVKGRVDAANRRMVSGESWIEQDGMIGAKAEGSFYWPTARELCAGMGMDPEEVPEKIARLLRPK
jgi:acyl-coenzyme A thioesterase PaaI-like protein